MKEPTYLKCIYTKNSTIIHHKWALITAHYLKKKHCQYILMGDKNDTDLTCVT